jgi:hypothetical protein
LAGLPVHRYLQERFNRGNDKEICGHHLLKQFSTIKTI